jgi:transposase-like protein
VSFNSVTRGAVHDWINRYKSMGDTGLKSILKQTQYSSYTKKNAVIDYLNGVGSLSQICIKYKIRSSTQLRRWIKKYNGYEELKTSGNGGFEIMTKGRKTTYEERIEIVKYCIENQNNYSMTATKFSISYQQVYSWMQKYEIFGIDGLIDKRGRTKPIIEMTELERLRAENRILKAENTRQSMEVLFLKKLEEIERRRN